MRPSVVWNGSRSCFIAEQVRIKFFKAQLTAELSRIRWNNQRCLSAVNDSVTFEIQFGPFHEVGGRYLPTI